MTLKWELLDVVSYHFSQEQEEQEEDNIPLKLLKSYDGTQDCTGKITDDDILTSCIEEMELRWSHSPSITVQPEITYHYC